MPGGFTDCARASGVDVGEVTWTLTTDRNPANGAVVTDCDVDGWPDALVFNWVAPTKLLRNRGGFRFEDVTASSGLDGDGPASAAAAGDLDGDGVQDLVVTRFPGHAAGASVEVFRGRGGCRYERVTSSWGFAAALETTPAAWSGVALGDHDLDGRLDVFLWSALPVKIGGGPRPTLLVARPDLTWHEAPRAWFDTQPGSCWALHFVDRDGDGLLDVFVVYDGHEGVPARFMRRVSAFPPAFADELLDDELFGPRGTDHSLMGARSADVDGDGRFETYLTDVGAQHLLAHGARGPVVEFARAAGVHAQRPPQGGRTVGFSTSFVDHDNDGRVDLLLTSSVDSGNRSPPYAFYFRGRGDGTFDEASALLRQTGPHGQESVATADFDRDGRLDVWLGGAGEAPRVLRNQLQAGRSLALRLRGRVSNPEGFGAVVRATVGSRVIHLLHGTDGNPSGGDDARLLVGLGALDRAERVEDAWPSGYTQRVGPLAAGGDTLVEEPAFFTVAPARVRAGEAIIVTVRPVDPVGAPLGPGRRVEVRATPGEALSVRDEADGRYTARTAATARGVVRFEASVDGVAYHARPAAIVE